MKKKDVTYLQVRSIAEKILLTGERPTIERVYMLLGQVATKKQVAEHLRRWRSENQMQEKSVTLKDKAHIDEIIAARTQELKRSLSLLRNTLESTEDGIILMDNSGKILEFNQKFVEITHVRKSALEHGDERTSLQSILSLLKKPEETLELIKYLQEHPEVSGDMGEVEFRDGRIIERYSQPYRMGDKVVGRVWSFRDVTNRRKAEEALRLRDRAITASPHAVVIFENNSAKKITYVNHAFTDITGISFEKISREGLVYLRGEAENNAEWQGLLHAITEKKEGVAILHNRREDGSWYWIRVGVAPVNDANNEVTHFVAIMTDITEQKALEKQLMYQATHDSLTDLPNRLLLEDRMRQMILLSSERDETLCAILFLDLDRFKLINDSLGHKIGDDVIKIIASRLRALVKKGDTVARLGGDEFVIMLMHLKERAEVDRVCKEILAVTSKQIKIADQEFAVTTSIGISLYPEDGDDMQALIRNADTAMYYAKDAGRNTFCYYFSQMNKKVSHLLQVETNLRKALKNQELELYYQPIIELKTERIVSMEALIRWNHPKLGLISPAEFIYVAEETGLIVPMGEWVLEEAARQCKQWVELGAPSIKVAVNVSVKQLHKTKLTAIVKKVLKEVQLPAQHLMIELTESILMECNEEILQVFNELNRLGVSLSIDDFGTGYSGLNYLKKLPFNKIKIDRVFINEVSNDPENQAIVNAIIAMAKKLKLIVLAEGAETLADVNYLRESNCDEVQGYYFSKPLPAKEATALLLENMKRFPEVSKNLGKF